MNTIINQLPLIQVILSVLLVIVILLQQSEESLGGAFGGSDSTDSVKKTRRGGEKLMFNAAITIAVLFTVTSIASFLLN
ncbi:MAG: preprotein translocase subunit SecG [Candidatus Pacebacteria bacterium]|nr:preprotein translocase subunit SecG [Candidatus Paceibacterota bacterium]